MSPAYHPQAVWIHKYVQRSSNKLINDGFLLEETKGGWGGSKQSGNNDPGQVSALPEPTVSDGLPARLASER